MIWQNYLKKIEEYEEKLKDEESTTNRIRTDQAKSFKGQKGKGYVNLPILSSKKYGNNSSKELKSNIKQLLKALYNKKQISKLVYNSIIEAITYKNDS